MKNYTLRLVAAFVALWTLSAGSPVAASSLDMANMIICTSQVDQSTPPDFTGTRCRKASTTILDPQNKAIWVKSSINLTETSGPDDQALALFVMGKMSSEFHVNGKYIGRNGTPGTNATNEIVGKMDAMIFIPPGLLRVGANEVIFKASSHNGFLRLENPVHNISIGAADNITDQILRHYWPSLLTLGLFILGALYFGVASLIGTARKQALTFCLICAFAAAQLFTEVMRGLVAYSYPVHDIRLVLITFFSAGFGLAVAHHVLSIFASSRLWQIMAGIVLSSVVAIILTPGFDGKAEVAILIPLAICLIATGYWTYLGQRRAFVYFLALLSFVAANIAFPNLFLDVIFFYLVAGFLLILFIEQGFTLAREAQSRRIEEARANRLELALDQAREREEASQINVKSAGKMTKVSTDQITHCRGASGYTEIILSDGREMLHSATLTEMEEDLPSTFVRVHRSFLVNVTFVQSLTRDPSGTGTIALTDGSEVPISRRILPQVRQILA